MCFLGTEKEPEEGAFKAFLQRHGGSSNAFTGMEATGYHFQVGPHALPDALERFGAFFTCPMFREDSARREMEAVDSEFRRNLQSDVRRLFQLTKGTSSKAHPFSKFSTGNLQTLSKTAVGGGKPHEAVRAFYERHYLAEQMHLCVLGRESLDELEAAVVRCFAELRTNADEGRSAALLPPVLPPTLEPSRTPFSPEQVGALLRATPVREMRLLRMMWQLPPEKDFLQSKTLRLLSSVASHEGEGSLSWLLTQRLEPPLATSVSCSSLYSLSDSSIWGFSITLTPDGLERYTEVASIVFGFLGSLSRSLRSANGSGGSSGRDGAGGGERDDASLPSHLLSERKTMSRLAFEYAEPSEPLALVKSLAGRMHLHEPARLLSAAFEWPDTPDVDEALEVLKKLSPDSMCLLLVDPAEIEESKRQVEEWYQTPYALTKLPEETLALWRDSHPHPELLTFPPQNPYVPDDLRMLSQPPSSDTDETRPEKAGADTTKAALASRTPVRLTSEADETALGVRAWHLDAGRFDRPRASVIALLRTPAVLEGGAKSAVLSQLAAELLCDQLTPNLAPCGLAGLGWSVSASMGGLLVQTSGYSQRLPRLSLDLAHALADFTPDEARFEVVREIFERSLRNKRQERPLWHAQAAISRTLGTPSYHSEEALAYVTSVECTAAAVLEHVRSVRGANFIEMLVHGNLLPSDATQLSADFRRILGGAALPSDCAPLPSFELLPPTSTPGEAALRLSGVASNPDESNSAIEVFYQFGELDLRDEALLLALSQVASKAAFQRLRTELQLGYVVQCGVRSVNRCRGLTVLIQSAVANPPALEDHVEEWITSFRAEKLASLTDEQLDEYKDAIACNLEEPPKTLHQEASGIWPEIFEGTHRWRHLLELAAEVRTLKADELRDLFDARVADGGAERRKAVSFWYSQKDQAAAKDAGEGP